MKSRGLRSVKCHPRRDPGFAAAMIMIFMAAAAFCFSFPANGAGVYSGAAAEEESTQSAGHAEAEKGWLVLEEPGEKTRYAEYEMAVGDTFSVTFIHSVNQSPVTDYFEIREDGIYGIKTVYYGFGAGVLDELSKEQTLAYGEDGSMIVTGPAVCMNSLIYRVGTVSDHILSIEEGDPVSLRDLCGRSARVGFRFEMED